MAFFWNKDDDLLTRLLTASSTGAVIGFGTCGLSAVVGAGGSRFFGAVTIIGSCLFALSAAVLAVTFIALVVRTVVRAFRR